MLLPATSANSSTSGIMQQQQQLSLQGLSTVAIRLQ